MAADGQQAILTPVKAERIDAQGLNVHCYTRPTITYLLVFLIHIYCKMTMDRSCLPCDTAGTRAHICIIFEFIVRYDPSYVGLFR